MKQSSYRDTWAEISMKAIYNNVRAFKKHIKSESQMLAVVKADGYGHGAAEVANEALKAGADYIGVALLDEALELREAGIAAPILVFGDTKSSAVAEAIKQGITITVFRTDAVEAMIAAAEKLNKKAKIHIKVDTGMGRVGVTSKEAALELMEKTASTLVEVEGIFTHFADADNLDDAYTREQFDTFLEMTSYIEERGFHIPIKHCCNSAGTIVYPEMHLDMCRVGVSMYGLYPAEHMREMIHLTQAMTFQTQSVMVKQLTEGQAVSYGCTFKAERDTLIATLPVGYADGLSRLLSNRGEVMVKGKRAPIVGRICMDQTMIDVTDIGPIAEDDIVTIFGDRNAGYISLDEVAEVLQTIHYEIVCLIGARVPRVYVD
jgi:alanine racemase